MGGAQQPAVPKAPNASKEYAKGAHVYLKFLPKFLAAEQGAREQYDPQRIQEQMGLESQFAPEHYQQQLTSLQTLDPQGTAIREQLGQRVGEDLSTGYQIPDAYRTELENNIRGAQAARGNILGNSAANEEAGYLGEAALRLYQQRLQNAGNFLAGATPEQQLLAVQPVTPDRTSQYVNPNAGYAGQQFALSNYQNLLAQRAASGGTASPWMNALQGAGAGASMGSVGGIYGTAGGAVTGAVLGYAGYPQLSDRRVKENIVPRGTRNGLTIYEFSYRNDPRRFVGVMADEVRKVVPRAVEKLKGFMSDFSAVNYRMLGLRLEEV